MRNYKILATCLVMLSFASVSAMDPVVTQFQISAKFKKIAGDAMKLKIGRTGTAEGQKVLVDFGALIASDDTIYFDYARKGQVKKLFAGKDPLWRKINIVLGQFGTKTLSPFIGTSRNLLGLRLKKTDAPATWKDAAKTAGKAYKDTMQAAKGVTGAEAYIKGQMGISR